MTALPPRLVLFDGVCGLCDRTVQYLLERDHAGVLSYATLQGETGRAIVARHPELEGVDSVVFVESAIDEERVSVRSKAVLRIFALLDGPERHLSLFSFLPAPLLDLAYGLVARTRYRLFGKLDTCRVPTPDVRARFLP